MKIRYEYDYQKSRKLLLESFEENYMKNKKRIKLRM